MQGTCRREARLRQVTCIAPITPLKACWASRRRYRPSDPVLSRSVVRDHAEKPPACFMFASVGVLSERYVHDGPGVCLDDGQTEPEVVPSHGRRGDALLRPMPQYLIIETQFANHISSGIARVVRRSDAWWCEQDYERHLLERAAPWNHVFYWTTRMVALPIRARYHLTLFSRSIC